MSKQAKLWFKGHKDSINDFKVSPNQSFLGPNHLLTGSSDKTSRLYDIRTQQNVRGFVGLPDGVSSVLFNGSASTPHVYLASGDKIFIYDLRNTSMIYNEPIQTLNAGEEVNNMVLNKSSNTLAIVNDNGELRTYKINKDELSPSVTKEVHDSIAMDVKFIGDKSTQVITGGYDSLMKIWDLNKPRPIDSFNMNETYELKSGSNDARQMINPPFVNTIQLTPDAKHIFCGTGDGSIKVFYQHIPPKSHKLQWTCHNVPEAHNYTVTNLELISKEDHNLVVSSANDAKIKVWKFPKKFNAKSDNSETLVECFEADPLVKFNCMRVVDNQASAILCTGVTRQNQLDYGVGWFDLI